MVVAQGVLRQLTASFGPWRRNHHPSHVLLPALLVFDEHKSKLADNWILNAKGPSSFRRHHRRSDWMKLTATHRENLPALHHSTKTLNITLALSTASGDIQPYG
ncbi:hypothetical protein [Verrucomicrobium spinosum]|uniref:hypothetical protein n=1 Tax=Verrucomicrobium spinosum TaxID=2736 RepID=UPI0012E14835|nr:hypothetical protein [Verrucomicrobium spinosum]